MTAAKNKHQQQTILVEGFNGEHYSATSAKKIVEQMRLRAFGGQASDGAAGFMRQVAKRVHDWSGSIINADDPMVFLTDLGKAGLIRIAIKGEEDAA